MPRARKYFTRLQLNEQALKLDIDPFSFKNKTLLFHELSKCPENKEDPVTLTPLDDIPCKFYVEWIQDNKKWGADARSVAELMRAGRFNLPWAIDYATGSYDPQAYNERFDMRLVPALMEEVDKVDNTGFKDATVSVKNQIIFDIDRLTDSQLYVTPVIVSMLESPFIVVYEKIASRLFDTAMMLRVGGDAQTCDVFHHFCYLQYTVSGFHIKDVAANLQFLICILKLVTSMCPEANVLQMVQFIFLDL